MTDHNNFTEWFNHAGLQGFFSEMSDEFTECIGELREVKQENCNFPCLSEIFVWTSLPTNVS